MGLSKVPELCSNSCTCLSTQPKKCHIFVDNQSVLHGIKSPWSTKYPPIQETHKQLVAHKLDFDLHWVKGHSDVLGNDTADSLAKLGARGTGVATETPLSRSQLIKKVNESLLLKQQENWNPNEETIRRELFPTFHSIRTFAKLSRPKKIFQCVNKLDFRDCHRVRRLVSGRYPTNDLLYKWNLVDTPICPWCGLDNDSISHLVRDCWIFGNQRITMMETTGFPTSIGHLLSSWDNIVALEIFLKDVSSA